MNISTEAEWTGADVRALEIESHKLFLKKCEHAEGESRIYCIMYPAHSAVKIGTSRNVKRRFIQLQTASPDPLYMHEHIRGGRDKEQEIHQRYARYRMSGEWFYNPDGLITSAFCQLAINEMIEDVMRAHVVAA